ncbi:DUF4261 domain-containing protein [Bacillus sp. 123MFChir2]|uniref:DUF4261 domain-containing protein n=1 Tax=Bacillus sp. 123MFChir2 TaxID=1169144 RepID=UPI00035E0E74|nr:DUF4261 domain-containing protein [Bacillus sp. 123MFChir2]
MTEPQIIIGIPGLWKSRTELVQEVVSKSKGYILAGNIIHHMEKNIGFEIDVYNHDYSLGEAFLYAGGGRFNQELLSRLEEHTHTVYVTAKVSDMQSIKEVIDVGMALLNAGGIALKIETVGLAYSKEEWKQLANNKELFPVYSHVVNLIGDEKGYYSCGMQIFALPDAMVHSSISLEEAADLLNDFNLYYLVEKPKLKDGDTISFTQNSPVYKLSQCNDYRYEQDDPFYNPCGLWKLEQV